MNAERSKAPGDPDIEIGQHVRSIRLAKGMSQEDLAQSVPYLGWSGATVAKIELGTRRLTAVELLVLMEDGFLDRNTIPGWRVLEAARSRSHAEKAFDATVRAADALGTSVDVVEQAAKRLWGRDFRQERDRRLAARENEGLPSGRGATGRVTRKMLDELRDALNDKKGNR